MSKRPLTYVCAYFMNPGMLEEQQRVWRSYHPKVKAHFHAIVTDDCSPERPAISHVEETGIASFTLCRANKKARWNWLFARNLGHDLARTEWVLFTDIDHLLPESTLLSLMEMKLDSACVYRLPRVDAPHPWPYALADCTVRENKRFHPNTWLMTRSMYDRVGGYDERLSGCYGTDGEFKDRVQATARAVVHLNDPMVRYGREILADASTTIYTRKNDPINDQDLRQRRSERDAILGWTPARVTFPWDRQVFIEGGQLLSVPVHAEA